MLPEMPEIEIIYEDKDLIVVNKPPGVSAHGGLRVTGPLLTDFLIERFPEVKTVGDFPHFRPGLVHRLDRDTSGVMVVARNQESFTALKELFMTRQIEKIYWAMVVGHLREREGRIELSIGRLRSNPSRQTVRRNASDQHLKGEKEAETFYHVLKEGEGFSLVELKPKTGRMHQLRVHLKAIGHPVACDRKYGGLHVKCPTGAARQMLHARSISFSFPPGRRLFFEADLPQDMKLALRETGMV